MNQTRKFPLVKIPEKEEIILYLIKEELKSRKLFLILQKVGLYECSFKPHLDSLILQKIGLEDGTDETFRRYNSIMEERSEKLTADYDSIMTQAMEAYAELLSEKKKLSTG